MLGFGNEYIDDTKVIRYYEIYFGIFEVDKTLNIISEKLQNKENFKENNQEKKPTDQRIKSKKSNIEEKN